MKIITLNVNGIRASINKGLFKFLEKQNADIVCLQETRIHSNQLNKNHYLANYFCRYQSAEKKGYSGVAIFSKKKPNDVKLSAWQEMNAEGRFLEFEFGNLSVISFYLPSGSRCYARQKFKMHILEDKLLPYFKSLSKTRKYIFCGDVNIVHKKIDIKNFNANKNRSGCLPEERKYLDNLFNNLGFVDGFREINQKEHEYTWWSNRGRAWENNTGWRIDYQILSPNLKGLVKKAFIYKNNRFSDHAPLIMKYNYAIT